MSLVVRWSWKHPLWLSYAISKVYNSKPLFPQLAHCKNKLVVLTTERLLLWLQTNWRDSGNERFTFRILEANCISQPKGQMPSSSYHHNTITTLITSVIPSSGSLLQLRSAFVMTPSQMICGLWVYCGCKMNCVAASGYFKQLVFHTFQ